MYQFSFAGVKIAHFPREHFPFTLKHQIIGTDASVDSYIHRAV